MSQSFDPNPNAPPGSPYAAPPVINPPPPSKNSAMPWIVGILVVLFVLIAVCCGGGYLMFRSGMSAFKQAVGNELLSEFRDDMSRSPEIRDNLGEIESAEMSFDFQQIVEFNAEHDEEAVMALDLKAENGEARLFLRQSDGASPLEGAILVMPDGTEIPITLDPEVEGEENPYVGDGDAADGNATDEGSDPFGSESSGADAGNGPQTNPFQ
ncbi:MAG: hypothetical protein AAF958_05660 [Planctomycetota bacterium]